MSCKNWNDEWIAYLYDEMEPAEAARVAAHLAACADCCATLDALDATRQALAEHAPAVPQAPHVLVLGARRARAHAWSFAAGLAAAAAVFAVALTVVPGLGRGTAPPQLALHEQRLARLEQQVQAAGKAPTREEFDAAVTRAAQRIEAAHAEDIDFLLGEIRSAERRTGRELMSNREALRYAMLASNPGLNER